MRPTALPKLHIPRQIVDLAAKSERNNTPRKPIAEAQISRFYSRWQVGRGATCSQDGRTPYPSAHNETCKAGFYTFIPHAGSLASAEERQEQPASAGFFLLAVSTGASLVWSTTHGDDMKDIAHCQRCGEFKDRHWFPPEMKAWYQQCNRCTRSPSGAMPLPQEECDRNEHQTKPNASNAI